MLHSLGPFTTHPVVSLCFYFFFFLFLFLVLVGLLASLSSI